MYAACIYVNKVVRYYYYCTSQNRLFPERMQTARRESAWHRQTNCVFVCMHEISNAILFLLNVCLFFIFHSRMFHLAHLLDLCCEHSICRYGYFGHRIVLCISSFNMAMKRCAHFNTIRLVEIENCVPEITFLLNKKRFILSG